jgi:hypothetical protein
MHVGHLIHGAAPHTTMRSYPYQRGLLVKCTRLHQQLCLLQSDSMILNNSTQHSTMTIHPKMSAPPITPRVPIKDLQKVFHYTDTMTRKPTRDNDPYEYMAGFGNRFQSEVIPGTLPAGQNNPQEPRFGLYAEGITYSAFTAPRHANFSTYMYRVRPAAAHSMFILFGILVEVVADFKRWVQDRYPAQG